MERPVVTPAVAADAAAVTEIVAALETALYGPSTYSEADLREEWSEIDLDRRTLASCATAIASSAMARCATGVRCGASRDTCTRTRPGAGVGTLIATGLEQDAARAGAAPDPQQRPRGRLCRPAACSSRSATSAVRVFREMRIELDAPPRRARVAGRAPGRPVRARSATRAPSTPRTRRPSRTTGTTRRATSSPGRRADHRDRALRPVAVVRRPGRRRDRRRARSRTADTYGGGFVQALFTRRPWRETGRGRRRMLRDAFARFWERGERQCRPRRRRGERHRRLPPLRARRHDAGARLAGVREAATRRRGLGHRFLHQGGDLLLLGRASAPSARMRSATCRRRRGSPCR